MRIFRRKFPIVRQYDQIDCGPAALLSVLKFWGGNSSIVHIRELAHTDASGTNMLGLVKAAEALGLRAYGASGEYEELLQESMPCLAHVVLESGLQHFVVLYKIDKKQVLVGDPGRGLYLMSKHDFLKIWKEKAVVLLAPQGQLCCQPPPHWLAWIFSYLKREENWLLQTIFLGLGATTLGLFIAFFVQELLDRFIPARDFFKIALTAALLLSLQFLRAGAGYLRQKFLLELHKRAGTRVNADFLQHIFHLPLRFFQTRKKGDITARINDGIKIQQAFLQILGTTVIDGMIILGSFLCLLIMAPALAGLAAFAVPLYTVLLLLMTRRIRDEQNEAMKNHARVQSFYFDSLNGIDDLLSYNAASAFAQTNLRLFEQFQHSIVRLGQAQARTILLAEITAGVLIVGTLGFGALLVIQKSLLLGQMMAAYTLLANMLPASNRLVDANVALQGASIAVQRLFDLLLVEKEKNQGQVAFRMQDAIYVEHAQFGWPQGQPLFHDLTLVIPRGQITALWGISGAGKSTLAKILQRKYALQQGQILVDAIALDDFELQDLRKNLAVVPQAVKIFNGTLLDNILLGRDLRDTQPLRNCLAAAGLTGFFARFENGLLTRVGEEGWQLSAGEMQIIGLVRALLGQPQVLIVDEAINAVDVEIENKMLEVLRAYARQHAVFLISHNLRRLMYADVLYLLENGIVSGQGEPQYLLRTHSRFQILWRLQQHTPATSFQELAYVA